jgi:Aldo/keto reductase family
MNIAMTRREFAALAGAVVLASPASAQTGEFMTRAIPGSGERLPAVGLGTAYVFDRNDEAEAVLGEVIAAAALRDKLFIATKLESPDAAELKRSQARLKTEKLDLLQLHNVRDPQQSLAQLRKWKEQGVCRYIGITSTRHGDFAAVEAILQREKPDFVQIDYSVDDREAEKRILPLARRDEMRRAHRTSVRPRPAVSRRARQGTSRLGKGVRRQLGAVLSQISPRRPAGDPGDPGHCRSGAYDRQSWRHARTTPRRRPTPPHGGVRRIALAGRNSAILAPISACAATGGAP